MVFMIPQIVGNFLFSISQILYIFYGDGKDLVSNEKVKERACCRSLGLVEDMESPGWCGGWITGLAFKRPGFKPLHYLR